MSATVPAVSATNLTKVFTGVGGSAVHAVSDVSLRLDAGQVLLLIGPSGSGKTTLLSLIGCLLPPTAGSLWIGGTDVVRSDPARLTRFRLERFGFVFQNFHLINALTVRENVELPLRLAGVHRREARERALGLLGQFGLGAHAESFPDVLSGGERQRTALARALAADPPILLADEPTGSLDSQAGARVVDLLASAAHASGKAVFIVSHDARIERHADVILRMEDGRVRSA